MFWHEGPNAIIASSEFFIYFQGIISGYKTFNMSCQMKFSTCMLLYVSCVTRKFKKKCTRPTSPVREHRKHKYVQMFVVDAVFCFVLFCFADPPSLDSSFPYNHTVTEGNNLTLQCKVTAANPTPNITWYNVSTNKTLISYKDNLTFGLITRSHAGRYQCAVENGIGQAAVSRISTVDVQCKLIQTKLLRY